jgi:cytochrome c1
MFKWWFALLCIDFVVLMWSQHDAGRALCRDRADRCGLLVRLFPGHPADPGRDREAAAQPATIEEDFNATTAPTAIRPSERKPSMFRKSHSLPHRPALASVASPRRRRAHIEDVAFAHEGPFGKFDQFQLQRGLQVYTEVCSACHGLKFVPIRSLSDAGGPGLRKTRSGLCQAVSP